MGTQPGTAADAPPAATIDLADHGFSRVASGPSPFIDAAAFLLLSSGETLQEEHFTAFDPSDPAFHGKDYIQRPLLAMIGGNDFIKDNSPNGGLRPGQNGFSAEDTDWFPSVTKAVGLNYAPAYGVVIDGANHVTPVSEFAGMPSWNFGTFWNWFNSVTSGAGGTNTKITLPLQLRTSEEHNVLQLNDVADLIIDTVQGMLPSLPVVTDEDEITRLATFQTYSRSFWDVYLSPSSLLINPVSDTTP